MTAWSAEVRARVGTFGIDATLAGDRRPLALVGPNGAGKTTLLRILAGALPAERAVIVVGDRVLTSTAEGIEVPIERRGVAYVPQGYGLFPHLTVLENVAFGLSAAGKATKDQHDQAARAMLDRLGCSSLADRRVTGLSGGEQQRVALARALVLEPDLLLLDEPLAALDATRRRAVRSFLADRLRAFGRPSLVVTHDVRDVAALDAVVCVLEEGRVVQQGDLDTVRGAPGSVFVEEFVAAI